jgi:phage regulator Rha-like protein
MNEMTLKNEKTMSSREISDLVESRHDAVKKSIERLVERGVIQCPPVANFKNINNVDGQEYLLCKRDSYVVVAQLCPEFTAKLVDRWQELEAKQVESLPNIVDPKIAAMMLLLTQYDAQQQLNKAIQTQQEAQKVAIEAQNARLDGIEAKNKAILDGSKFYSVAGFASLHGIKIDIKAAATYGRAATAESRALGIIIGSIPDPRFGKVHTYHEDVLAGVFAL